MACSTSQSDIDTESNHRGHMTVDEDKIDDMKGKKINDMIDLSDDFDKNGNIKSLDSDDEEEVDTKEESEDWFNDCEMREIPEMPYDDSKSVHDFESIFWCYRKCNAYLWYISGVELKTGDKKKKHVLNIEEGIVRMVSDYACHNDTFVRSREQWERLDGVFWTRVYETYHPWARITGL